MRIKKGTTGTMGGSDYSRRIGRAAHVAHAAFVAAGWMWNDGVTSYVPREGEIALRLSGLIEGVQAEPPGTSIGTGRLMATLAEDGDIMLSLDIGDSYPVLDLEDE